MNIDILVFVATVATMYSPSGVRLLMAAVKGQQHPFDVTTAIVRIMEEGFRRDKQMRTSRISPPTSRSSAECAHWRATIAATRSPSLRPAHMLRSNFGGME
jgi:hypothetical protein